MTLTGAVLLGLLTLLGATTVPKTAATQSVRKPASGWALKAEQMARSLLPEKEMDEASGFFAPVTKKYMPVMRSFEREYAAAPEKMSVIRRYLPRAEAALNEAKAMKVPPKYAEKKAHYIQMFDALLGMAKMMLAMEARMKEK